MPVGFVLSAGGTASAWTTYATLPSLTTRGGAVHLVANPGSCVNAGLAAGACAIRWLRDGAFVASATWTLTAQGLLVPLPGLQWIDTVAPAGAHVYSYQVQAGANCTITSGQVSDGGFLAQEIG
jgi:hypothetical protein